MEGVRVLEVAQYTFVPSAAAVLADWGAQVIKVEHAERGDAQRGLVRVLGLDAMAPGSRFVPLMEGPNRGKRSIGLDLSKPESAEILTALVRDCDVFLTNFLPNARAKMGIEVDDIRRMNPNVIYVRGSGFGDKGPERDSGGYDSTAFWSRSGSAHALTSPEAEDLVGMPTGAFGDSIGGMIIAAGIAAALFKRERTGEASVVDVSLLGVGAWATQYGTNIAMLTGGPLPQGSSRSGSPSNPMTGAYRTKDGRFLMFGMLQPGVYWPMFCRLVGRADLVADERFADAESIMANAAAGASIIAEIVASKELGEWRTVLTGFDGQWSAIQDFWEVSQDASIRANGLIAQVTDADGVPRELVASPVLFDGEPAHLTRAPQFAEHTDEILRELRFDLGRLIELKLAGVIT